MQSDQITYASTITEQERLFGRCPVVADIVKGGSAADDGKAVLSRLAAGRTVTECVCVFERERACVCVCACVVC